MKKAKADSQLGCIRVYFENHIAIISVEYLAGCLPRRAK